VILNWYNKNEVFWTRTDVEDIKLAKEKALLNATIQLAAIVKRSKDSVYRYITEDNTQRWEVHEQ
jgi:hypothetical protein